MDKRITIFDDKSCYSVPANALEFMKFFQDKIDKIPNQYLDSARIDIDAETYYDSACLSVNIHYYRPETPDEIALREKTEAAVVESTKLAKLREFERLRNELGL